MQKVAYLCKLSIRKSQSLKFFFLEYSSRSKKITERMHLHETFQSAVPHAPHEREYL